MAKRRSRKVEAARVATAEPVGVEETTPAEETAKPPFSFPSKSRCPRCKSVDTIATSTKGIVQYRKCRMPVCREKYTVRGTDISK